MGTAMAGKKVKTLCKWYFIHILHSLLLSLPFPILFPLPSRLAPPPVPALSPPFRIPSGQYCGRGGGGGGQNSGGDGVEKVWERQEVGWGRPEKIRKKAKKKKKKRGAIDLCVSNATTNRLSEGNLECGESENTSYKGIE
ncbi:hypothetical protein GGS23DRAFT_223751 [Durotheca rogersii]|uniref:uncharacterized protein n=1 Tax=Durotheca rogersii TaxID=419775 RepID=UPI00221EA8AC|nr:uncharacterized protein GGS23DRAFT_223751 [Durotheca rogersii]KAI5860750.1 hypothetical protein GGS23DRAFT_223751 [Durotheca rogersii]